MYKSIELSIRRDSLSYVLTWCNWRYHTETCHFLTLDYNIFSTLPFDYKCICRHNAYYFCTEISKDEWSFVEKKKTTIIDMDSCKSWSFLGARLFDSKRCLHFQLKLWSYQSVDCVYHRLISVGVASRTREYWTYM